MLVVLQQRNFALLWVAGLVSSVGTWALYNALPFYVYTQTGSALATGAMLVAQTIPRIALAPIAGVYADRWDRRRTMIAANVARALVLLPLLVVHSRESLWVIYVIAFSEASLSQIFDPARNALLPRLVGERLLLAANALDALAGPLVRLIAPALGGALLALVGLVSLILTDSASHLVSATLLVLLRIPAPPSDSPPPTDPIGPASHPSPWTHGLAGVRMVLRDAVLRALFLIGGVVMVGYGIITVLLIVFAGDVLSGNALVFGSLVTAQGIGGLVGAAVTGGLAKLWSPARLVGASLLASGLFYLLAVNVPIAPVDVALIAALGLPIACFWICTQTLLQERAPDAFRGRVFGAHGMVNSLAILVGIGIGSVAAGPLGVVATLDGAAGLYLLGGVIALALLPIRRTFPLGFASI